MITPPRLALFTLTLALAACRADTATRQQASSAAPVRTAQAALEQVPAELSVAHFGEMRLEGTDFRLENVQEEHAAYVRHTVSYRSNGLRITGILNMPKGEGPFPLLVLNHGYIDPAVYTNGRGLRREQDFLARRGFAVLHTDYRGHAGSDPSPDTRKLYDAGLEYAMDSANAILALREAALPRIDTQRVGMLGHSMGGGVTLNILTARPELVRAAVLYAPVHADAFENFLRWRADRDDDDRTAETFGTVRADHAEEWDALSSQTHLGRVAAPVLVFHGTNDRDVPFSWSQDLTRNLAAARKQVALVSYPGEGHEFAPRFADFMERTAAFFARELASPAPLPLYDAARATKKPFGIHIDPATSPVQPERFAGYHMGVDFELLPGEDPHALTVTALCDGTVLFAGSADGYGGVVAQSCSLGDGEITVLYGHLAPRRMLVAKGDSVIAGQALGVLGKGETPETDGERAHLHLAAHRGAALELRGYAARADDLSAWRDPLGLFPAFAD